MLFNVTSLQDKESQVRENMTHIEHVKTACGVVCVCVCVKNGLDLHEVTKEATGMMRCCGI